MCDRLFALVSATVLVVPAAWAIPVMIMCCLPIVMKAEDERIWIEATVNDREAHFIFDTGDPDYYTLFRVGAERLGITVTNQTGQLDSWYTGYTPECSLKIRDQTVKTWFLVIDLPLTLTNHFSADGLIGWPCFTNTVMTIDAKADMMLRFWRVPQDTTGWLKLSLQSNAPVLRLLIPKPNGKKSVIVVDTGSGKGIALRSDLWRTWRSSHADQPTTLMESYGFASGMTDVREEAWAKEIEFGPLTLTDVPIMEASSVDLGLGGEDYEATLGLTALKRLDLIVDSIHNVAYLRPKDEKPVPYKHNRLAVCFVPQDLKDTNNVAHVLKNGPGYNAGIRDGDILLKVDGRDVNWMSPDYMSPGLEERPSGTKVTLTLKRGTKVFETSVVLNDILKP